MTRPTLRREASVPSGVVIVFRGRPLMTVRQIGNGRDAPVILEEMSDVGPAAKGQLSLWSADGVLRAMEVAP